MTTPHTPRLLKGTPRTTTPQTPDLTKPARPTGWRCDCHGTRWVLTTARPTQAIVSMAPAEPEIYPDLSTLLDAHIPVTVCDVDNVATLWAEKSNLEWQLQALEEKHRRLTENAKALAATVAHAREQRDTALACALLLEDRLAARTGT